MSRRERFTPYEKEQACLDYINGNRSRSEICNCLHISTRTIQDWAAIYKKYGILPVSVDELPPVARVSGFPEIPRFSFVHALSIRACGRRLAAELGKPFETLNAVVAHLGAGFSIVSEGGGSSTVPTGWEVSPFSPERAGGAAADPVDRAVLFAKQTRPP